MSAKKKITAETLFPLQDAARPEKLTGRPVRAQMTILVKPEARTELRMLCAELNRTQQELFAEALNLLFKQHGKKQAA